MFKKIKNNFDLLLQKIDYITDTITSLSNQNAKIFEEQSELKTLIKDNTTSKPDEKGNSPQYTSYEKGTFNKPKESFYDSPAEKDLEKYLNSICKKYNLGLNCGIRLLSHQPLINYIETTKIKAVNNRNAMMHFDFLFEARKLMDFDMTDDKSGHFPLLVIELDGKFHDMEKQKERDEYKQGVCDKLNLHLIRIKYFDETFNWENFQNEYLEEIITYIFVSIFNLGLKNLKTEAKLELLKTNKEKILNKYPKAQFPEIHKYIDNAFTLSRDMIL